MEQTDREILLQILAELKEIRSSQLVGVGIKKKSAASGKPTLERHIKDYIRKIEKKWIRNQIAVELPFDEVMTRLQADEKFMSNWQDYILGDEDKKPTLYLEGGFTPRYLKHGTLGEWKASKI